MNPDGLRPAADGTCREVFWTSLRLGLTSFGGPIAHLGYFREEYVARKKWLTDASYADLVALCQFLPGPASSQVNLAIGLMRAGPVGALLAWLGFTLPSALIMLLFALGVEHFDISDAGWVQGLKIVAVAVVAQAIWGMARKVCTGPIQIGIALVVAGIALASSLALTQVMIIVAAGLIGWRLFPVSKAIAVGQSALGVTRRLAAGCLAALGGLLVLLPVLRTGNPDGTIGLIDSLFRPGALVFGTGHAVLPLLEGGMVDSGWMSRSEFVAGYGAAQAVPGPLFTFSTYLGAVRGPEPNGVSGALIALFAIFLPSALLILGVLPFWDALRSRAGVQGALIGINAAVVGILLAALYDPVWTSAIHHPADLGLALVCLALLMHWKRPAWMVVIVAAVGGQAIVFL